MKKQEITAAVLSLFQIDREDPVRQETWPLAPPPKRTSTSRKMDINTGSRGPFVPEIKPV
jgi:hypothetical protein